VARKIDRRQKLEMLDFMRTLRGQSLANQILVFFAPLPDIRPNWQVICRALGQRPLIYTRIHQLQITA